MSNEQINNAPEAVELKSKQHPKLQEFLFSLKRFLKNPLSIIGLTIILSFALIAIFAPVIAPPYKPDNPYMIPHDGWTQEPQPPSIENPLGTMPEQYDIFYGMVWGTRNAFYIGFFITFFNLIIGLTIGTIAGYFGGIIDEILMRIVDLFYALPFLVVAMALVVVIGRGLQSIILVYIILGWRQYARIIRSEILILRDKDYIQAAKASGASHLRIIFSHILPNSIFSVLIVASMSVGSVILGAAALSFLGLGSGVGYADWGTIVSTCRDFIVGPPGNRLAYWFLVFTPGFVISLFVLGWNLLGDAVRDVFDPKMRRK
ncbi:MAG: ABC transporter permease [Spirochaetaceae bacterium]|jgi:peptide/nickel transport system permease protein|nr:ABC transporter permease [Spirochaetaceae bacterium]